LESGAAYSSSGKQHDDDGGEGDSERRRMGRAQRFIAFEYESLGEQRTTRKENRSTRSRDDRGRSEMADG
jgi:hypothetical protein